MMSTRTLTVVLVLAALAWAAILGVPTHLAGAPAVVTLVVAGSPLAVAGIVAALLWVLRYLGRRADARRQAARDRLDHWLGTQHLDRLRAESDAALTALARATRTPRLYLEVIPERNTVLLPTPHERPVPYVADVVDLSPPRLISVDEAQARRRHPVTGRRPVLDRQT